MRTRRGSAVHHRRQPALEAPAVELHLRLGAEGGEDLLPLLLAELVEGELVVVAHEGRPLAVLVDRRARLERLRQGPGVLPGEEGTSTAS